MKTFSNQYIFIYSAVLVTAAALILTVVSVSLKPLQERNQQAEQKQMILKTIGVEVTRNNAAELYDKYISEITFVSEDGTKFPYYTFDDGIVLPLHGTGLWGPIWGYLALDCSGNVVGAVFDHKGETPGLGGEIATEKFAQRFIGKMMDEHPIYLTKNADKDNPYQVDAISGGTMTSNGVTDMLEKAWLNYHELTFEEREEATE